MSERKVKFNNYFQDYTLNVVNNMDCALEICINSFKLCDNLQKKFIIKYL